MTLDEMILDGLRDANVIREDQSASPIQSDKATQVFNGLMSMWSADGIDIGDYPVTGSDTLDIEREHEEPIRTIFSVALRVKFGIEVEPQQAAMAEEYFDFLLRNTFVRPKPNARHAPLGVTRRFNITNG